MENIYITRFCKLASLHARDIMFYQTAPFINCLFLIKGVYLLSVNVLTRSVIECEADPIFSSCF